MSLFTPLQNEEEKPAKLESLQRLQMYAKQGDSKADKTPKRVMETGTEVSRW